jgi:hypothetical protein
MCNIPHLNIDSTLHKALLVWDLSAKTLFHWSRQSERPSNGTCGKGLLKTIKYQGWQKS